MQTGLRIPCQCSSTKRHHSRRHARRQLRHRVRNARARRTAASLSRRVSGCQRLGCCLRRKPASRKGVNLRFRTNCILYSGKRRCSSVGRAAPHNAQVIGSVDRGSQLLPAEAFSVPTARCDWRSPLRRGHGAHTGSMSMLIHHVARPLAARSSTAARQCSRMSRRLHRQLEWKSSAIMAPGIIVDQHDLVHKLPAHSEAVRQHGNAQAVGKSPRSIACGDPAWARNMVSPDRLHAIDLACAAP